MILVVLVVPCGEWGACWLHYLFHLKREKKGKREREREKQREREREAEEEEEEGEGEGEEEGEEEEEEEGEEDQLWKSLLQLWSLMTNLLKWTGPSHGPVPWKFVENGSLIRV